MTFWVCAPLLLALQLPLPLPSSVVEWKAEVEAALGVPVRILSFTPKRDAPTELQFLEETSGALQPVPSPLLPAEASLLNQYLANPAFTQALDRAQALTLSLRLEDRVRPFVFLNWGRLQQSANDPAMLLAHEIGHLWLQSQGLFPPKFDGGSEACLAVHSGDIVQHERIRQEMDRREIPWRLPYQLDYEASLAAARLAGPVPAGSPCTRAQRLSLLLDLRLGFSAAGNTWRNEYLALLGAQDPAAEALALELAESLPENYSDALAKVQEAVIRLVARPLD